MSNKSFSSTIVVDKSAKEVFEAVNNVTKWWTENLKGKSKKLNDEFEVQFGDIHYSKQKLVEVIPDQKVVWLVTDSNLSFVKHKQEWNNTKIVFEIEPKGRKTQLRFTHDGLVPDIECFEACSNAWAGYFQNSLHKLITAGKGEPTPKD